MIVKGSDLRTQISLPFLCKQFALQIAQMFFLPYGKVFAYCDSLASLGWVGHSSARIFDSYLTRFRPQDPPQVPDRNRNEGLMYAVRIHPTRYIPAGSNQAHIGGVKGVIEALNFTICL